MMHCPSFLSVKRPLVSAEALKSDPGKCAPNPRLLDVRRHQHPHGDEGEKPVMMPKQLVAKMKFDVLGEPPSPCKRCYQRNRIPSEINHPSHLLHATLGVGSR